MDTDDIVAAGYERSIVVDVLSRLERNGAQTLADVSGPRVTSKAFAKDGAGHLHLSMIGVIDFDGRKNQLLHLKP